MKKSVYIFSIMSLMVAFMAGSVWAASKGGSDEISPNEGSDSCGLAWQVTKQKTLIGTSTRGTTNAYLSPTWSMTSGTSGCEKHQFSKREEEAVKYVSTNLYPLTAEMAEGHGEYLVGLAQVMGCNDSVVSDFGRVTQKSFNSMSKTADAYETLQHVKQEIRKIPSLAQSCALIG